MCVCCTDMFCALYWCVTQAAPRLIAIDVSGCRGLTRMAFQVGWRGGLGTSFHLSRRGGVLT